MTEKTEAESIPEEAGPGPLHGILAEYDSPTAIIRAARRVRDAGYTKWDTFTPYPVHGIDSAMGIKMTGLPWIVFGAAMAGLATAILLTWWTNTVDYPWLISGKPFWSIPAHVPIYFELTVLFSAFASLFGMLALNNLPYPSHPLDWKPRFGRSTNDRFFVYVEAADPKFDEEETRALLEGTSAARVEGVHEDRSTPAVMPRGIAYGLVILTVASLIPFALAAKARASTSRDPKIHLMGDMDWQAKFQAQQENPLFPDKMQMRPPEPGTVALGDLQEDDHFYRGKVGDAWARTFPPQVLINDQTMARGRQRFGIYCSPCHGLAGQGDGMVSQRAMSLAEGTWIPPSVLTQDYLRVMPVGQIFNTITHGIRNMPPYGHHIPPEDRWAIILYLRALQKTKAAAVAELSPDERSQIK